MRRMALMPFHVLRVPNYLLPFIYSSLCFLIATPKRKEKSNKIKLKKLWYSYFTVTPCIWAKNLNFNCKWFFCQASYVIFSKPIKLSFKDFVFLILKRVPTSSSYRYRAFNRLGAFCSWLWGLYLLYLVRLSQCFIRLSYKVLVFIL